MLSWCERCNSYWRKYEDWVGEKQDCSCKKFYFKVENCHFDEDDFEDFVWSVSEENALEKIAQWHWELDPYNVDEREEIRVFLKDRGVFYIWGELKIEWNSERIEE